MYLIITNNYPSNEEIYANGFIHSRVRHYMQAGLKIKVFVITRKNLRKYVFEGIEVERGTYKSLIDELKTIEYKKLLIHFLLPDTIKAIKASKYSNQIIVWFHGYGAMSWRRRLFSFNFLNPYEYAKLIYVIIRNINQLVRLRNFIKKYKAQITPVTVSEWMKNVFESDVGSFMDNWEIIHNIVDEEFFLYVEKNIEQRTKILLIRPFSSYKYANDIAAKAILSLSKEPYFNELEFLIAGKGKLFKKITRDISSFPNVKLLNQFITHSKISEYHKQYGVFLCPTRNDTQGVSMCEAMSSGLVSVTSNCTAIPEFVDNSCGYLTNSVSEIKKAIEELYYNPDIFQEKSRNAHEQMLRLCSKKETISRELEIISSE